MLLKYLLLFFVTAIFEILGCYSVLLFKNAVKSDSLGELHLINAVVFLGIFAWLLTLHPSHAGRVYASYAGVYVLVSLLWLWLVEDLSPTLMDIVGVCLVIVGSLVISSQYLIGERA